MIERIGWIGAALCVALAAAAEAQTPREKIADVIEPILQHPGHDGLLIFDVMPKLQADRAGFRIGDIITHYDGKEVRTASQLQKFAQLASGENRGNIPVAAMRGSERKEAEFDAAPMGVRLVAVHRDDKRILWRPNTPYEPDFSIVKKRLAKAHRWELIEFGDKQVGWAHSYCVEAGDHLVLRVQSQAKAEVKGATERDQLHERRDITLAFAATRPQLELRALRLQVNNKTILDLAVRGDVLVGDRSGIRDSAPLPRDVVVADLAGIVAGTMPKQRGVCMRCSYLESGALVAAPFADLFCLGSEVVNTGKESVSAYRFDQTVFGRSVAHYWIDSSGDVVQTKLGSGFRIFRATSTQVGLQFPGAMNEFSPIEQLPMLQTIPSAMAN
jgi:hypothetical protein